MNGNKETILIVDDIESNVSLLNNILSFKYNVLIALDGKSALELANEYIPDLILLDIMMPDMDGYDVCKELKSNEQTSHIPVIFNTARTDEKSIEKAYSVGGVDYICKPFKPKEILVRVEIQLNIQRVLKDLKRSKRQLALLSAIDPLTKLYNRRYFRIYSDNIINSAKKDNSPVSVVMFDLDNFKKINDTYGHSIGDEVLVSISQMLQNISEDRYILCRYGGEEFAILLQNTSLIDAEKFAFVIQSEMSKLKIEVEVDSYISVTASIGVSGVNLDIEDDIEAALNRADSALYEVKNSTKNGVCVRI